MIKHILQYLFENYSAVFYNVRRPTLRALIFANINFYGTNFCDWDHRKVLYAQLIFANHSWLIKIEELIVAIGKKCFDDSSSVGKKIANISI